MLEYLAPYEKNCQLKELQLLALERQQWLKRSSSQKYVELLKGLPILKASSVSTNSGQVVIGTPEEITAKQKEIVAQTSKELIPWKKGPFNLFGLEIDAEWRSDHKWDRLKDHIDPIKNKRVLDIGCNNGYFMFRLAEQNPLMILGIDPVIHNYFQFNFLQHFARVPNLKYELFGVEHLNMFNNFFDVIFCMGIIYHHRNPIQQLEDVVQALQPGGQLILETIGIPGDSSVALFPHDRYANMRNVWFIPTLNCLINWSIKAKLVDIEIVSSTVLTSKEQRLTTWCPPPHQSLEDFLDPHDQAKTIEGFDAPMRFCIKARKKR